MDDNSWLSERTKTWIVAIVMSIIVIGSLWGFWAAHQWKADRAEQKIEQLIDLPNQSN